MKSWKRCCLAVLALTCGCGGQVTKLQPSASSVPGVSPSASSVPAPVAPASFDTREALEHVRVLAGIGPRPAGSVQEQQAADYVESVFRELEYEVRRETVIRPDGGSSDNVIGRLPGANYLAGFLLVGAHYDTVAGSPGANDNASGVAVMLSAAEALSGAATPVEFVAFAAEERQPPTGGALNGSGAYAGRVDGSTVEAMISVDMVGNGPSLVVGRFRGSPAELQMELASRAADLAIPVEFTDRYFSDHVPFARKGIPAAGLSSGDHPTFHSPEDVFGVVQPVNLEWAGRTLLSWILDRSAVGS